MFTIPHFTCAPCKSNGRLSLLQLPLPTIFDIVQRGPHFSYHFLLFAPFYSHIFTFYIYQLNTTVKWNSNQGPNEQTSKLAIETSMRDISD